MKHWGLILTQVHKFQPNSVSGHEDLIQAGAIGLLNAVRKFDPNRGVKFSTYAWHAIRKSILKEATKFRIDKSISDTTAKSSTVLWESWPDSLSALELQILELRYISKHTIKSISETTGLTKKRISKYIKMSIRKIEKANETKSSIC